MAEKDYEKEYKELKEYSEHLKDDYSDEFSKRCKLESENRELKSMNDKLLKIIENLSEGIAANNE